VLADDDQRSARNEAATRVIDGLEGLLDAAEIKHDDGQCAARGTSCAASGFREPPMSCVSMAGEHSFSLAATSSRVLAEVRGKAIVGAVEVEGHARVHDEGRARLR
jgi:hypothetical protein